MCLGLGGDAKDMERGDLADFIMKGAAEANIRIELQGAPGAPDTVITRRLTKSSGAVRARSSWTFNSKPLKQDAEGKEELLGVLARLHIQMDNPCQFLAQERVGSFSQQSPQKLLAFTLKAVNVDMVKEYADLKEKYKVQGQGKSRLAAVAQELQELEAKCARMVALLKNWEKYQAIETDIKLLSVVMVSAERDKAAADAEVLRASAHKDDEDVEARLKNHPAALAAAAAAAGRKGEAEADAKAAAGKLAALQSSAIQLHSKLETQTDLCARFNEDLQSAHDDEATRKKAIARAYLSLEGMKRDEAAVRKEAGRLTAKEGEVEAARCKEKEAEADALGDALNAQRAQLTSLKKGAAGATAQLEQMRNLQGARAKALKPAYRAMLADLKDAAAQGRFRGAVEAFPIVDVKVLEDFLRQVGPLENALHSPWGDGVLYSDEADRGLLLEILAKHGGATLVAVTRAQQARCEEKLREAAARCAALKGALKGLKDLVPAASMARVPPLLLTCVVEKNFFSTKFVTSDSGLPQKVEAALSGRDAGAAPPATLIGASFFFPEGSFVVRGPRHNTRAPALLPKFLHHNVDDAALARATEAAAGAAKAAADAQAAFTASSAKFAQLSKEVEALEASLRQWKAAQKDLSMRIKRREEQEKKVAQMEASAKGNTSEELLRGNMASLRAAQVAALGFATEYTDCLKMLEAVAAASAGSALVARFEREVWLSKQDAANEFARIQKQKEEKKAKRVEEVKKLLALAEAKVRSCTRPPRPTSSVCAGP
jgi:hypothetical protein